MTIISIEKISLRYIFLFLIPVFIACNTFTAYPLYEQSYHLHPLFFCFEISCGEFICGGLVELISLLITKFKKKTNQAILEGLNMSTTTGKFDKEKFTSSSNMRFQYILIVSLGLIDCCSNSLMNFTSMQSYSSLIGYQLKPFQIITTALFSIKILGLPLYCHHITSIIIIVIGLLFIVTNVSYMLQTINQFDFVPVLLFLIGYTGLSLKDAGEKWLMDKQFWRPFRILLLEGSVGLTALIPVFIAAYLAPCKLGWRFCIVDNPIETFSKLMASAFSLNLARYSVALILLNGGLNSCNILTNHLLSPTHKSVGESLASIILGITILKSDEAKLDIPFNWVLIIIGDILIITASILFNEIVVLHFCGMSKNTKREIMKRSEDEGKLLDLKDLNVSIENDEVLKN